MDVRTGQLMDEDEMKKLVEEKPEREYDIRPIPQKLQHHATALMDWRKRELRKIERREKIEKARRVKRARARKAKLSRKRNR